MCGAGDGSGRHRGGQPGRPQGGPQCAQTWAHPCTRTQTAAIPWCSRCVPWDLWLFGDCAVRRCSGKDGRGREEGEGRGARRGADPGTGLEVVGVAGFRQGGFGEPEGVGKRLSPTGQVMRQSHPSECAADLVLLMDEPVAVGNGIGPDHSRRRFDSCPRVSSGGFSEIHHQRVAGASCRSPSTE